MVAQLDTPVDLPAEFEGIITIYPDSENTAETHRYWLVPNTARIVRRPDQTLAFGLVHSGVSSWDPDGISALLNVTVQPYVDSATLDSARKFIQGQVGATASFSYVTPSETTCKLLVAGQYLNWGNRPDGLIKGGSVDAGLPFQVKLTNSMDVRALAQYGGPNAALFGALFTMKFPGVGNRVHAILEADFTETYKHFAARVSGSAWFGLAKADVKTEWQELKKLPFVKLTILSGTEEDVEKFHLQDLLSKLIEQINNRTGLFAQGVKPSGLPDAPGGGGFMGWGVSVGGGFESYSDTTEFRIEIDVQYTRQQEIAFGMNFAIGGDEMRSYVKNVTDADKPFPTSDDFKKQGEQARQCISRNIGALKTLHESGALSDDQYHEFVADSLKRGCYANYGALASLSASLADRSPRRVKEAIDQFGTFLNGQSFGGRHRA